MPGDVPPNDELLTEALRAAERAQRSAGISIRTLDDPNEQGVAVRIFDQVWPLGSGATNVTPNLFRALTHSGGYAAAAFDTTSGDALGSALAVVGRHRTLEGSWHTHLHSHMAAVVDGYRNRSIGTAIKLHQRAWAMGHDIDTIVWSFDPLVRRNAWLNLHKLGTEVRGYEPNFYGEMDDAINVGDPSDRVFAWWLLDSDRACAAANGPIPPVVVGVGTDAIRIATPEDVVSLRRDSPEDASEWRMRVRGQFLQAFDAGYRVAGLDADGSYVLTREKER